MDERFTQEELACIKSSEWWADEITHHITPQAASIIYNYIAYLEELAGEWVQRQYLLRVADIYEDDE